MKTDERKVKAKMQRNTDVRRAIAEAGLHHWELAEKLGISENTLVRWLRYQLPEEKKRLILDTIEREVKKRNES